ncbi:MAG TPA: hypothetical protein VFS75_02370 [Candidatus Paceibacterota bacterium]|nr:hypothetical protein [Candidatus Paceibacterota bacterium]
MRKDMEHDSNSSYASTRPRGWLYIALFALFAAPHTSHAALLYLDPAATELHRGDTVTMALRLDVDEGECVNTIRGVVHYDPSIRAVDVSRGDSIFSIWVEDPLIDEAAHTITFAGGIPGGYCGRIPGDPSLTNVILRIVFRAPGFTVGAGSEPEAKVSIDEGSEAYLNDGVGTAAPLRVADATVSLLPTAGDTLSDDWRTVVQNDKDAPADFDITLATSTTAFSGKYFITFNSADKQSGIDHYEVMEEPFTEWSAFKWGAADAPWTKAESPYVLKDQSLNSTIRVKAIDKAGNVRIETLVPDTALRSISRDRLLTILVFTGLGVVLAAVVFYALWRRRNRILAEEAQKETEIL